MRATIRIFLTLNFVVGLGIICLHAEGVTSSPSDDKPPVDIKGNDSEGLISGFSSEPINSTQKDIDYFMVESLKDGQNCSYVESPDSTLGGRMEEYFNLMLPTLMNTDSSNFELIEIL